MNYVNLRFRIRSNIYISMHQMELTACTYTKSHADGSSSFVLCVLNKSDIKYFMLVSRFIDHHYVVVKKATISISNMQLYVFLWKIYLFFQAKILQFEFIWCRKKQFTLFSKFSLPLLSVQVRLHEKKTHNRLILSCNQKHTCFNSTTHRCNYIRTMNFLQFTYSLLCDSSFVLPTKRITFTCLNWVAFPVGIT